MPRTAPRRCGGLLVTIVAALPLLGSPGCATATGLLTGAFTGAVDGPAEVYRHNHSELDRNPEYWVFNVFVMGPLGFVGGPFAGFAKGVALDVQWLLGQVDYEDVFADTGPESIWRPYAMRW